MTINPGEGKIYYYNFIFEEIYKADLDGSNIESIYSDGSATVSGIDVSPERGKVYLLEETATADSRFKRMNLDGTSTETLSTVPDRPSGGISLFFDGDSDGVADQMDECPGDSSKSTAGQCGCGNAETDSDSDGTADCVDACDEDATKTSAGICGCGVADTDTDLDGTPDCNDECSTDSEKTEMGFCGCGVLETDTDSDGTPDCNDLCETDPNKTEEGLCGCGTPDTDSDQDGTPDCNESSGGFPAPQLLKANSSTKSSSLSRVSRI